MMQNYLFGMEEGISMEIEALPQYMRIAARLASRISMGEFHEGRRISGRSLLSSEYGVSPETVRKALRVLSDLGIVSVREGSGTVVLSAEKAGQYLETIKIRQEQTHLHERLKQLAGEYIDIGKQMDSVVTSLLASVSMPLPSEQSLPNFEVQVPENSDKVGMSIGDLRFWQCTGATIVAVRRGQSIYVSPGPYYKLHAGDVLIYVGASDCRKAVETLLGGGKTDRSLLRIQEQITTAIHAQELSIIAEALDAKMGDITEIRSLTKGMTNRSFLFTCKGKKYILRIPGEGTGNLIDRAKEAENYRAIAGRGFCDDPDYLNPKNGLKVTRFLENVRSCDPYSADDLKLVMAKLRELHSARINVSHNFDLIGTIEYYESLWRGKPSQYTDYTLTKKNVFSLQPFVALHRAEPCLTHIDAVPDNFLFYQKEDGTEGLQLTDWEYSGMQDPHVDIAMFCLYSGYNREQCDRLIDLYFQGECKWAIRVKIYCYISICGLLWSNWCEYKSHLGVDFGDYALSQYQYAKDYYEIVRKELADHE